MIIKCTCNDPKYKTEIKFDKLSHLLWFTDKDGKETNMYLNPNVIAYLMNELREVYLQMLEEEQ